MHAVVKPNPAVAEILAREILTVEDANTVLRYYSDKLQSLGSIRTPILKSLKDNEYELDAIRERNMEKLAMLGVGTGGVLAGIMASLGVDPSSEPAGLFPIASFILGPTVLGFVGLLFVPNKQSAFHAVLSPFWYRRVKTDMVLNERLHALKEAEYEQAKAQIVKKARKAIKVLNASLASESKEIVCSSTLGQEGFITKYISPPGNRHQIASSDQRAS